MATSQSSIFSHLIFHFRNPWYKLSFYIQSIFGHSIYGIYICCIACTWLVEGWNHGLCNTTSSSELGSCDKLESSCNSFSLVLSTWLDFLAILGIWESAFNTCRTLLIKYNRITKLFTEYSYVNTKNNWSCILLVGLLNLVFSGLIHFKHVKYKCSELYLEMSL